MPQPITLLRRAALWAAWTAAVLPAIAAGQVPLSETPPGPVGGVPAQLPRLRLPELTEIQVAVPRPVRAAQAVLGLGQQRLALVVGLGTIGTRLVVDSAVRDSQAVAAALRNGGFLVMQRNDVSAAELRRALKEFRERLQPGSTGFVYVAGLGVQFDGRNLLLTREAPLESGAAPAALASALRAAAVPLEELTDALVGPVDSQRLLVVDAAYRHPALAGLAQPGLAEPRLPNGTMALFGHALGQLREVPAVAPLPMPAPTDAVAIAATPFARTLVAALQTPRISGPEALRQTRRLLAEAQLGEAGPWLGGDTDGREEFSEPTLLDGLVPRTPDEIAREGARQASRLMSRPEAARAGELPVSDVLRPASTVDETVRDPADKPRKLPETPGSASTLGSVAGNAASVLGTAAGAAATVGGIAATARVAEAAVAVTAATTAVGTTTSVLGNAVALAARATAGGGTPASEAARQAAAAVTPLPQIKPASMTPVTAPAPTPTLPLPPPTLAPAPGVPQIGPLPAAPGAEVASTLDRRIAQTALSNAAEGDAPRNDKVTRDGPPATDGRTERAANGGERPVYTPRSNPFGYAEGDTFTYQVTDTWKGEVVREYTTAIEEVLSDGALRANGQQLLMDAQGRVTRLLDAEGTLSQYEPAQALWWARPEAGERRIVKYLEKFRRADNAAGQTEWKGSARVGRLRKIETPAGEFEVLPVESSGWWYQKMANGTLSSGQWSRTAYYAPQLGHPVAIEIENADRMGKLLKRERIDLLHAQTTRGKP